MVVVFFFFNIIGTRLQGTFLRFLVFFPFVSWGSSYITHDIGKIISTAAVDSALTRGQAVSRIAWLCECTKMRCSRREASVWIQTLWVYV